MFAPQKTFDSLNNKCRLYRFLPIYYLAKPSSDSKIFESNSRLEKLARGPRDRIGAILVKDEGETERERERNRFEKADGGGSVHAGGRWLRGRTYIIT